MPNESMRLIPAGSLLTVTTGVYSDYSVHGVFKALQDIDANILRAQWFVLHPEQAEGYRFDEDAFLGWLARLNFIEALDCFEFHMSDYSRADTMEVTFMGKEEE